MAVAPIKTIKIYYCYAPADSALRDELEKHLSPLRRLRQITGWYNRDIQAGADWAHEIEMQLNTASIILLLVSPDFIHSDYCYSIEMQRALERHKAGEAIVIPIILRPVHWQETPLGELDVLPKGGKPVTRWSDQDEALWEVVLGIRKVVATLLVKWAISEKEMDIFSQEEERILYERWTDQPTQPQSVTPLLDAPMLTQQWHVSMSALSSVESPQLAGDVPPVPSFSQPISKALTQSMGRSYNQQTSDKADDMVSSLSPVQSVPLNIVDNENIPSSLISRPRTWILMGLVLLLVISSIVGLAAYFNVIDPSKVVLQTPPRGTFTTSTTGLASLSPSQSVGTESPLEKVPLVKLGWPVISQYSTIEVADDHTTYTFSADAVDQSIDIGHGNPVHGSSIIFKLWLVQSIPTAELFLIPTAGLQNVNTIQTPLTGMVHGQPYGEVSGLNFDSNTSQTQLSNLKGRAVWRYQVSPSVAPGNYDLVVLDDWNNRFINWSWANIEITN